MLNMKRCKEGHFYDADKNRSCPYCNPTVSAIDVTVPLDMSGILEGKDKLHQQPGKMTEPEIDDDGDITTPLEEALRDAQEGDPGNLMMEDDPGITVSFYSSSLGTEPVVGWLTCIEGLHYGKSFLLRSERTFIGRDSRKNDVALAGDPSVARERHAIITYDPKGKCFIAQPGNARELYYLNDQILLNNQLLSAYDVLKIGDEKLLFIPLCGEQFCWENTGNFNGAKKAAS